MAYNEAKFQLHRWEMTHRMMLKKLRIAMVCYPTYGGSGAVATELGRHLARLGHTIHFISYARPFRLAGDYHPNIFHHEITSEHYPLFQGELYGISAATKILEVIRNVGLDLLHLHYALPHAISAWLAMEMLDQHEPVPTVTTLHGTDITLVGSKPSFLPAVQLGLDKSDHLTSVSRWLAERTRQLFKIHNTIRIIPNFVDPEVFSHRPERCCRDHFADPDEKVCAHISNFRPVKRVGDVIRTFARICRKVPARLLMIGDGPDREQAEILSVDLGIPDRVSWLGRQPSVESFLPCADLFLFPSNGESFGLAALEAMACAVPVIGANAGGLPEVVLDTETGYLCEMGDTDAMAEAGLKILLDPEHQRTLGTAARRRAIEKFSAEIIIPLYETMYRDILETPRSRNNEETCIQE
jgi:N-acetyl-alpha-D-glucosaminyl L-malate synthase BshA